MTTNTIILHHSLIWPQTILQLLHLCPAGRHFTPPATTDLTLLPCGPPTPLILPRPTQQFTQFYIFIIINWGRWRGLVIHNSWWDPQKSGGEENVACFWRGAPSPFTNESVGSRDVTVLSLTLPTRNQQQHHPDPHPRFCFLSFTRIKVKIIKKNKKNKSVGLFFLFSRPSPSLSSLSLSFVVVAVAVAVAVVLSYLWWRRLLSIDCGGAPM